MNSFLGSKTPQHDSLYYWDNVTFLVENVLFRVPRRYFQTHSSVFGDVFSLPLGGKNPEGSSDDNPFKLESISKVDFQRLLKVIYPENPLRPVILSREEWISVLKLSTLWELDDPRERALDELSKVGLGAVDKVVLGKSYRVGKWLLEGYIELVQRDTTISDADVAAIGTYTAIQLFRIREESSRKSNLRPESVKRRVCETFNKELNETGWKESGPPLV